MRKNVIKYFFNGSGNPFADINYMEALHGSLPPKTGANLLELHWVLNCFPNYVRWTSGLLYWGGNNDYISRCLSLG